MMTKYTFNMFEVVRWPDADTFRRVVLEESMNDTVMWGEDVNGRLWVECKHKPKDMPAHGIIWEKLDE